jgi:septum formation protein
MWMSPPCRLSPRPTTFSGWRAAKPWQPPRMPGRMRLCWRDASEAESMLRQLCGRTHQVLTAIAVHNPRSGALETDLCVSNVPMRKYTDAEMFAYITSGDPLDKAGAYAIQNGAFRPVAAFSGCYACVVGLPLCHLQRTFSRLGFPPPENVPTACQNHLSYNCPIYLRVLQGERIG